MNYTTVIGLEIHVELSTKSKGYCGCKNGFGDQVNTNCCPVCAGFPGALPTLNKEVVNHAVRTGLAFGSRVNPLSKQDRKNYFYPDTAKAYQISQFDMPICQGGKVDFIDSSGKLKSIALERIQIEEDAGKMLHNDVFEGTLVDYNRSGIPLIEIVTLPDLRSSEDAKAFLEALRLSLIALGVTDGKMQEGSIRCDVNVSVCPEGSKEFGTRVEMKNVNTFSGAARAINYESNRQIQLINAGGTVSQETRRWNDAAGVNEILRTKENAAEYRYFPEPDLKVIHVTDEILALAGKDMPELPHMQVLRLIDDYNLPLQDAIILIEQKDKGAFFMEAASLKRVNNATLANWILGDITRSLLEHKLSLGESKLSPEKLADMIELIERDKISNAAGKVVIEGLLYSDKTTEEIVKEKDLLQISDSSALGSIVEKIIADNPQTIEQYRSGKTNVLGFLVGQAMKASQGQGNPTMLRELFLELLKEE